MADTPTEFTVKFGKIGRTLDYDDPEGHLVFTFDLRPGEDKFVCLEHHAARKQAAPRYGIAFERTRRFLESCGYHVEIYGELATPTLIQASDITALIQGELVGLPQPLKARFDLRECLILPARTVFQSHSGNDAWDLWLVFEERPVTKDGYKIVFDQYSKQFGAAKGKVFIGFEGTFIQTLQAISSSA